VRAGAEGTSAEPNSDTGPAGVDELTAGEAGDDLRTGERFVRRLIAERHIPHVNLGEYVRVQRSALDTFLESGRVPTCHMLAGSRAQVGRRRG
jgi:excisionase family DNA binding protein